MNMPFSEWLQQVYDADILHFLPVSPWIGSMAVGLPEHHKDPQDRIIIATALYHKAKLLSMDAQFLRYRELEGVLIGLS
ncbi:MAG: PIN domain-containing protein [Magnetococcus sp. YQC-5]